MPTRHLSPGQPGRHLRESARRGRPIALAKRLTNVPWGRARAGEADIVVRFAKCCSPVPAIISWPHQPWPRVIVHTLAAPSAEPGSSGRWKCPGRGTRMLRPVRGGHLHRSPGILAAISKCFTEFGVNIVQPSARPPRTAAASTLSKSRSITSTTEEGRAGAAGDRGVTSAERQLDVKKRVRWRCVSAFDLALRPC